MEPQPIIKPSKPSSLPLIISIILLLFSLASSAFLYYQNSLLQQQLTSLRTPAPSLPQITPTPLVDLTAAWKTYTSPNLNYSFKYPDAWQLLAFKEADPQVKFGVHSLHSYPVTNIETFMDHGQVDWKGFLGEQAAIKIDFAAYSNKPGVNHHDDKTAFLKQLLNDAQKQATSDLTIGNLPTEQYKTTQNLGPTDVPEINTFIAYPDSSRLIYVTVLFWNKPTYQELKNTPEWQQLSQTLSTFTFTPCGSCPQYMPPAPDFCKTGTTIPGIVDSCGCQQPPTCQLK